MMKIRKSFCIGFLILPCFSGAQSTPLDAELVSFWRFDGVLEEHSGTVHDNLTARDERGRPATVRFVDASEVAGTSGRAVALGVHPGDAQYLTAAPTDDLRLGNSYTIEAWIYPTELATWNRLVLQWGNSPSYAYHMALHHGAASLYHGQKDGSFVFAEGGSVQTDRWQHLAVVAQRNQTDPSQSFLKVYLNGRLVAQNHFDGTIGTLEREPVGIGDSGGIPSGSTRYRGYIDEIAMWKRPLQPEEIRRHYETRAPLLRRLEIARRSEQYRLLEPYGVEEIVFAERAPGRDPSQHYYANFGYSCTDPDYWIHGQDGGRLCKVNIRTGEVTILVDDPGGAVRDPQVHYDGRTILFSYRKGGSHHYNLYEIHADGTGLRQITSGPWDDIEPTYLPDGDIAFCSTRCKRYIGCWLAQSATLHRCDSAGRRIRMLSSGAFSENTPSVLPDGRLLYTRWEYVNRDPVVFHHLWTVRPDGTSQMVYYGNMHPGGVFIDAKPIPGTDGVVFIHSPGHGRNEHAGYVAVVSTHQGPDAKEAMRQISRSGQFRDPAPLASDAFLVASVNQIVLMNAEGRTEVLHTAAQMVHEPCPLVRRKREANVYPRVNLAQTNSTVVLTDIYRGRAMAGVKRGAVKKLLVLEDLPKPANYHGGGSQPIGHGVTSTLKRILGTVPVAADGSAAFIVPAMRSIYVAALDEADRSIKQMRSFVTLQPGETTGCVGCHEARTEAPRHNNLSVVHALSGPPSRIEPIEGVPAILDFPRDVQPILNRHCVRCHGPEKREGGVVLSGDRGPVFSLSYYELLLTWQVKDTHGDPSHGSGRQPGNDQPYTTYSSASPLMDKISPQHYEVKMTPRERAVVRLWIDTSAQYAGTYAAYGTGQIGGCWGNNEPIREMADAWPETPPAQEAMNRRCGSCHPKNQLPRHVTARIPLDAWGDMLSWVRPLSRYSRHRIFNLSRPAQSLVLLAPLSRATGGYAEEAQKGLPPKVIAEDRGQPPQPIVHPVVFTDRNDPDYQKILVHIQAAKRKLDEIKRFDMPDFRPAPGYVREMQRYGVLPASLDVSRNPIDVYATDEVYWQSLWHQPVTAGLAQ